VILNVASLLISGAALTISYVALVYTARPRVRVKLMNGRLVTTGDLTELRFRAMMRSRLKRAATDLRMYVIFPQEITPIEVRFGGALERCSSDVRSGRGSHRYLVVSGVRLSRDEPIPYEDFVVQAQIPQIPGIYRGWITSFAHNSTDDCGVSHFQITVVAQEPDGTGIRSNE
jgi:hypothetical protein